MCMCYGWGVTCGLTNCRPSLGARNIVKYNGFVHMYVLSVGLQHSGFTYCRPSLGAANTVKYDGFVHMYVLGVGGPT